MREDERLRYTSFVSARYTALFRTACLLTGDPDSAQDLVESALVEVYLSWNRPEVKDRPDACARGVLAHQFVSPRRWRWRREGNPDGRTGPGATAPQDGPVGRVDPVTGWQQLARLTAQQRAVVVLLHHEDLSERETAADLGMSPRAVQGHHRAAMDSWERP